MPLRLTSTIALLVGNLLPIAGVLLWDWDVRSIITLYWSENLILGSIMLIKMFYLSGFGALPNIFFFLVHYGAFCAGHGIFIAEFFAPENLVELGTTATDAGPFSALSGPITSIFSEASSLWWWAFVALVVSHSVSFLVNWLGQREYASETRGSLMTAPYRRIMILHFTVLLGGVAVTELGEPVYLVVVLVLVKIGIDLLMHRREHGAPGKAFGSVRDLALDPNIDPNIDHANSADGIPERLNSRSFGNSKE